MKRYIVLLLFMSLYSHDRVFQVASEHMVINKKTEAIYHRYYLIKRLKSAVKLLCKKGVAEHISFEKIDPTLYSHSEIQKIVMLMQEKKSLDPLFDLWTTFKAYQFVYDIAFKNECIELLFSIYECLQPGSQKNRINLSLEQKLQSIDAVCDYCVLGERRAGNRITRQPLEVNTDQIAKCFLVKKRLNKAMQLLTYIHNKGSQPFSQRNTLGRYDDSMHILLKEIDHFSHSRIRDCIFQMCEGKQLEPLLQVCKEFKQYRYASDESFLQEMLMNIFLVYKSLLFKSLSEQTEQVIMVEMNQVLEIYEKLDEMPLDETLEAIDMVTDKLMAIQHMQERGGSYAKWLVLPSIVGVAGLGVLYYYVHY